MNSIDFIIQKCRKLFLEKLKDYGLSWKFFHNNSIIDQILIKIIRIKNIESKGYQKVKNEIIIDTYIDIINYLLILLIKLDIFFISNFHKISNNDVISIYNKKWDQIKNYTNFCCMNKILNKFSINHFLDKILFLKQNPEIKELEKFCFKILTQIILLLE
ncbi:nucleotide modification associated domain-containing protein [Blattabacterium cuenoti]|uniref:nucleotide modification associated domain-containing protein n=1 Tax=Blattabacterium cuenoti TaxID=1653831 RepID=UPI00163C8E90|nr:nucleotide modification associated domain-containing protein [Blattabacterium cuenoti]